MTYVLGSVVLESVEDVGMVFSPEDGLYDGLVRNPSLVRRTTYVLLGSRDVVALSISVVHEPE